jgi:NAD(P)-dependent dehydrogenase (short-subunit alcohol dehydrogenase family)
MTKLFDDLQGKNVLITGASGGLGKHFASVLVEHGANVAIAARREDELARVAAELGRPGHKVVPVKLDVTDAKSVQLAIESAVRELGSLEVLINNSGVSSNAPVLDQSEADWDRVHDTNVKGAFLTSTAFARYARSASRPGNIINIASVLGIRQASHVTPYAASKAALIQLTKELALELARYQIRANALAPGYLLTDINREFFQTEDGTKLLKRIPQRRLGAFPDLDGPLLLLASDASRYMTGTTLVVDGGHLVSTL